MNPIKLCTIITHHIWNYSYPIHFMVSLMITNHYISITNPLTNTLNCTSLKLIYLNIVMKTIFRFILVLIINVLMNSILNIKFNQVLIIYPFLILYKILYYILEFTARDLISIQFWFKKEILVFN